MIKATDFYSKWNQTIKDWHQSPQLHFENDIYSKTYKTKSEKYKLKPEYIPEPYLGDIEKNMRFHKS